MQLDVAALKENMIHVGRSKIKFKFSSFHATQKTKSSP